MLAKLRAACLAMILAWTPSLAAEEMPSAAAFFAATLDEVQAGKPLAMESLRGKPVLINFWARWCGPCRDEIPELVSAYEKNKSKGLVLVGVAVEDDIFKVREFAEAYKMSYLVVMGKDGAIGMMRDLGNTRAGLPFTLAIDRKGNVVGKKMGVLTPVDLDDMLAAAQAKR